MLILKGGEVCPYGSICIHAKGISELLPFCWGTQNREKYHQFTCQYVSDGSIIGSKMNDFDVTKMNQVIDGKFIGYHEDISKFGLKRGDTVIIKKGVMYHTTKDGNCYITKRTHKVRVDHIIHGAQYMERGKPIIKNTEVRWAGSGGYWKSIDINDVIL